MFSYVVLLQTNLPADWLLFFGRFHPVLVHLPIGFLVVAALLEVGRLCRWVEVKASTVTFILFWAALSATLAGGFGYLLSLGGGYDEVLLQTHKWQGIWVAVAAWVAWIVRSDRFSQLLGFGQLLYAPALVLGLVYMMLAGHNGGSLTHGQDYLTAHTPEPLRTWAGLPARVEIAKILPITDLPKALVYQQIVQPILNQTCVQCHNAQKSKGDLRMDVPALLAKGGENGPIFLAGNSGESEMIRRCLLPLDDEHHMPPKGKTQLTKGQVTLLTWWIDQGAPFDKKVIDLKITDAARPALAALTGASATKTDADLNEKKGESPVMTMSIPVPNPEAVAQLKAVGMLVMPLARGQHLLEVSAINAPDFDDLQAAELANLSQQVAWLRLSNTKITDKSMAVVANFKNLIKINLEGTAVTDAGLIFLSKLPYLESINLVGTRVTDAGLKSLLNLKHLKTVYGWRSEITVAGAGSFQKQNPDAQINVGIETKAKK